MAIIHVDQCWIEAVHDLNYILRFEEACLSGMTDFDCPDNIMGPETYEVAMLAAGGIIDVAARIMKGETDAIDVYDSNLTFKGLKFIYDRNNTHGNR